MFLLWFTGLSGSGKSTIGNKIKELNPDIVLLDGDVLREGLCNDLGFSERDREENMRRLLEVCKILQSCGLNIITTFISPYKKWRQLAKKSLVNCKIVYCNASLKICEKRDVKGLYKKARKGEIKNFTGIDSKYEVPEADIVLNTEKESIDDCVKQVMESAYERYLTFIGRFNPLHDGHKYIMLKKQKETGKPLLILIRDTKYEKCVFERYINIKKWLKEDGIDGTAMIIPDIQGVYFGRKVGYDIESVDAPKEIKEISATKIRNVQNM